MEDDLTIPQMVERVREVVLNLEVCSVCLIVTECKMMNYAWVCEICAELIMDDLARIKKARE